jgi:hypothetical protein
MVVLVSVATHDTSHAESPPALPALPGFTGLGQVLVDKTGCASCPAVFVTSKRHRGFALASDTPFPISQSGRVDVTCTEGTTYHVFLYSPRHGGVFQLIPNSCVNFDSKEIKLTVTSVSLSPADAERSVALVAYGSFG